MGNEKIFYYMSGEEANKVFDLETLTLHTGGLYEPCIKGRMLFVYNGDLVIDLKENENFYINLKVG
ncbi:MAG: hypothetical protein FWG14_07920 [Peptococcaceae bacterium]|nr:hypothetical protein [Peptococcaceae bacterium]